MLQRHSVSQEYITLKVFLLHWIKSLILHFSTDEVIGLYLEAVLQENLHASLYMKIKNSLVRCSDYEY